MRVGKFGRPAFAFWALNIVLPVVEENDLIPSRRLNGGETLASWLSYLGRLEHKKEFWRCSEGMQSYSFPAMSNANHFCNYFYIYCDVLHNNYLQILSQELGVLWSTWMTIARNILEFPWLKDLCSNLLCRILSKIFVKSKAIVLEMNLLSSV